MSTSYGHRFGKPDIERLGLFSEMDYMNGKGYKPLYGSNLINIFDGLQLKCEIFQNQIT